MFYIDLYLTEEERHDCPLQRARRASQRGEGSLLASVLCILSFLWSSPSWEAIVKLLPLGTIFSSSNCTVSVGFFFPSLLIKIFVSGHMVPGKVSRHVIFWYSRKNLMEASQEFLATRGIWTFKRPRYKDTAVVSLVTSDFQLCKYTHGMKFYHLSHTECTLQWPLGYSCLCWPPSSHPSQSFSVFQAETLHP